VNAISRASTSPRKPSLPSWAAPVPPLPLPTKVDNSSADEFGVPAEEVVLKDISSPILEERQRSPLRKDRSRSPEAPPVLDGSREEMPDLEKDTEGVADGLQEEQALELQVEDPETLPLEQMEVQTVDPSILSSTTVQDDMDVEDQPPTSEVTLPENSELEPIPHSPPSTPIEEPVDPEIRQTTVETAPQEISDHSPVPAVSNATAMQDIEIQENNPTTSIESQDLLPSPSPPPTNCKRRKMSIEIPASSKRTKYNHTDPSPTPAPSSIDPSPANTSPISSGLSTTYSSTSSITDRRVVFKLKFQESGTASPEPKRRKGTAKETGSKTAVQKEADVSKAADISRNSSISETTPQPELLDCIVVRRDFKNVRRPTCLPFFAYD